MQSPPHFLLEAPLPTSETRMKSAIQNQVPSVTKENLTNIYIYIYIYIYI